MSLARLFRVFDWLCALIAMIPIVIAVATLSGHGHRWIDILAQFVAPLFWACLISALITLILHMKASFAACAIGALLLAIAVWPQWFPTAPKPQDGAPVITVYSANLWARNTDVDAMAASIAASNADIIILVEVGLSPSAELDRLLAGYPHRATSDVGNVTVAPARALVASRWPVRPIPENHTDGLAAIGAMVETPLGDVGTMSAHLTRPWPYMPQWGQIIQVQKLAELRPELGTKAIIAGDFNSVSSARIGKQVQETMAMKPAPAVLGTWPTFLPALFGITIDQIWHSPELAVVDRKLGQKNGSDHRPVITRITQAAR